MVDKKEKKDDVGAFEHFMDFDEWHKTLLISLIKFIQMHYPSEFEKYLKEYWEMLAGN